MIYRVKVFALQTDDPISIPSIAYGALSIATYCPQTDIQIEHTAGRDQGDFFKCRAQALQDPEFEPQHHLPQHYWV